jgi:plastocyanin
MDQACNQRTYERLRERALLDSSTTMVALKVYRHQLYMEDDMVLQSHIQPVRRSFVVVTLVVLLAACGSAAQAPRPTTDGPMVELRDNLFHPAQLEVAVGTTVTWWWNDGMFGGHDVVMPEVFSVPEQTSGTFQHQFDTPGTYTYVCTLHDGMTGTIIVNADGAGTTP